MTFLTFVCPTSGPRNFSTGSPPSPRWRPSSRSQKRSDVDCPNSCSEPVWNKNTPWSEKWKMKNEVKNVVIFLTSRRCHPATFSWNSIRQRDCSEHAGRRTVWFDVHGKLGWSANPLHLLLFEKNAKNAKQKQRKWWWKMMKSNVMRDQTWKWQLPFWAVKKTTSLMTHFKWSVLFSILIKAPYLVK